MMNFLLDFPIYALNFFLLKEFGKCHSNLRNLTEKLGNVTEKSGQFNVTADVFPFFPV